MPSPAPRIVSGLVTSPSCSSCPACARWSARPASRTMQRTSAPASESLCAKRPPTNPVAPVTSAFKGEHSGILRRVIARGLAVVALALLVAVGCDGSDDEQPRATTEQSQPPAQGAPEATGSAVTGLRLRRVGTFSEPTYVTAPPGDRRRLFVVEQGGTIRVIHRGRR